MKSHRISLFYTATLVLAAVGSGALGWWFANDQPVAETQRSVLEAILTPDPHPGSASEQQDRPTPRLRPESIATLESPFARTLAWHRLAISLGPVELADNIDALLRDDRQHAPAIEILLTRLAELDPYHAVEFVTTMSAAEPRWHTIAFQALGAVNPDSAIASAASLPAIPRVEAARGILNARPDRSVTERIDLAVTLNTPDALDLQPNEFSAAWAHASSLPDAEPMLAHLLTHWARADPPAALSAAGLKRDNLLVAHATIVAIDRWAAESPERVYEWLTQQNGSADLLRYGRTVAFQYLARDDIAAAHARLQTLPTRDRRELQSVLLPEWLAQDQAGALASILADTNAKSRNHGLRIATRHLMDQSPNALFALLSSLDEADRVRVASHAITHRTPASPELAVQILDNYIDAASRAKLGRTLVQHWGRRDLQATSAWIERQPYELHAQYQTLLTRTLAARDQAAALQHALTLYPAEVRDPALAETFRHKKDVDLARQAFEAIESAATKRKAAQKMVALLEQNNRADAAAELRRAYPPPEPRELRATSTSRE